MAHELDHIEVGGDCPGCGRTFAVPYKTLRLGRSIECQGCGETIHLEDGSPVSAIQRLIDEANRQGR